MPATLAAQYLRMSTEHQQYSLENQAAAIQRYAEAHSIAIVKTYSDAGKSGLRLKNRAGLKQLLEDVMSGKHAFTTVLVYDVSRWGRFQDADEAAHYEFLCKSAGVPVRYCAESFDNDGSLPSSLLKALKRTMAGEYSRELGVKCFEGQRRLASLGFRVGGTAGYGFRRLMVSAEGKPKQKLQRGEYKSLKTDRVVLVPGPKKEVECIRDIYRTFLRSRGTKTLTAIARELNQNGVKFIDGRVWNDHSVREVLSNPKYVGCNVWGRTSQRLRSPQLRVPAPNWTRKQGAFTPLIDEKTFERAQALLRTRLEKKPDHVLLTKLRRLLERKGHLSKEIIDKAHDVPAVSSYFRRFGGLQRAYELVGYRCAPDIFTRTARSRQTEKLQAGVIEQLKMYFPDHITCFRSARKKKRQIILVDGEIAVSVIACRSYRTPFGKTGWVLHPVPRERNYTTLICALNAVNDAVERLYLVPRIDTARGQYKFGVDDPWLARGTPLKSLSEFHRVTLEIARAQTAIGTAAS